MAVMVDPIKIQLSASVRAFFYGNGVMYPAFTPSRGISYWPHFLTGILKSISFMNKLSTLSIFSLLLLMASCQVIGDIFNTGVFLGAFMVVFVIGLIVILVLRGRK
jgi:hypothetical protein